ncbi:hypothetical protein LTR85_000050 [Meristemomyces frigidus]|nr:hypothetical protein LTR85_000050 [Meristemomyces frigidus]
MEHLQLNGPIPELRVPYLAPPEGVDYTQFETIPAQPCWKKLWKQPYLHPDELYRHSPNELNCMLLTRLFFGLLSEFSSQVVETSRFVEKDDDGEYVSTKSLASFLKSWEDDVRDWQPAEKAARGAAVRQLLVHNQTRLIQLPCQPDPALQTLLSLLHESLVLAAGPWPNLPLSEHELYRPGLPPYNSHVFELLMRLLESRGWCPNVARMACEMGSLHATLYVVSLGQCERTRDHSRCTESICQALQTIGNEKAQDVAPGSECGPVGPDQDRIRKIIVNGDIPLLSRQRNTEDGQDFAIKAYEEGDVYVAISHVCADRFANATSNDIPTCQLERILTAMSTLPSESRPTTLSSENNTTSRKDNSNWFWMDNLCVPVRDEQAGQAERRKSF